jgi:hypothetical protein
MTEAEWTACADPQRLLEFLRGKASERKLRLFACGCVRRMWRYLDASARQLVEVEEAVADGASRAADPDWPPPSHWLRGPSAWEAAGYAIRTSTRYEQQARAGLVRDVFGQLFYQRAPANDWLNATVMKLAQGIYAGGTFDHIPVLGDALEEAGCHDHVLLSHCRQGGRHVRGCWVVDLILSKDR